MMMMMANKIPLPLTPVVDLFAEVVDVVAGSVAASEDEELNVANKTVDDYDSDP